MKKRGKRGLIGMLLFFMLAGQTLAGWPSSNVQADGKEGVDDLLIYQNLPQAEVEDGQDTINLKALHVYQDGHFMWTSDLEWESTNQNVATVDDDGTVTMTGQPGRSHIKVTDGHYTDRISVHTKPDKKPGEKGKPDFKPTIIKQTGERYQLVDDALANMSLEEKLGQMMMPDFRNWDGENVTEMLPEIEQMVQDYHLGGVILFRENVVTTAQTTELVADYQAASEKYGMLVTIDQEGGIVTRLQSGTDMPGNMALGATRSETISHNVGEAIGEELNSLGINMNLAPVMDVNNNPDNPVIGVRSFGEDPQLVSDLGVSYIEGVQDAGVAATAKHFPGHGDTAVDSHIGLPEVPYGMERLEEVELYPFQQAMNAGVDAIMTAHVTFPKIDDSTAISKKTGEEINIPATLSHDVLTGLMREQMGYEGVIYTDALNMNAIADHFGPVDAAVRAVKAGSDIVLMPVGISDVAEGLQEAVETGEISVDRIEQSVERILDLKLKKGVMKSEQPEPLEDKIEQAEQVVGSDEHKAVETEAARESITLVKNDQSLPIEGNPDEDIVVIGNTYVDALGSAVKEQHENTTIMNLGSDYALSDEQLQHVREADHVITGTYTYNVSTRSDDHPQMEMVDQVMSEAEGNVIGVGIRNPYDIMAYPDVDAYVAQYGFRDASFEATAAALFGDYAPTGQLPVSIPGTGDNTTLYDFGHGLSY
ncbi:glycoside hydrolase family 3 protein [Thalassobacillus sp. CUG 92003]|uniref:glycoside hydrolase family 3 protein n=1 Tax=Thalassobacillus sp. CUG 92003 TaxID=2736641 RepID=UPI0015E78B22|nr:glycoside hydrolase family 3 protein [Thalassobacillus sp. CUG 92003]